MPLTESVGEAGLTPFQRARVQQINTPVPGIRLYSLERLVNQVAVAQDRKISYNKNGFRSIYRPSMLDEPLKKFMAPKTFSPNWSDLTTAVSRVRKKLKPIGQVKPITFDQSYELLLNAKSTNFSGLPFMGKKGEDTEAFERALACAKGKCPPPCVIGHRGKNSEVARPVWMFPFEWHICEGVFFFPLQERFKRHVAIYAADNAEERRAKFNEIAVDERYNSKIAMDYSGFDASISSVFIGIVFNLLQEFFVLDSEHLSLWNRVAAYFATSPFINQYGELVSGRKGGVPSGSMFTQLFDTVANAIVIEYSLIREKKRYFVYGDDSLVFLEASVEEAKELLNEVKRRSRTLGVQVNLKKTEVVGPCEISEFLGHYDLHKGRPTEEVLTRLFFPERPFKVDADSLATRLISYMAESDELISLFMPVYTMIRALARNPGSKPNIPSFADGYGYGLTTVELGNSHPRYLPGLAQYLVNEDPQLASSYMRIRAAL